MTITVIYFLQHRLFSSNGWDRKIQAIDIKQEKVSSLNYFLIDEKIFLQSLCLHPYSFYRHAFIGKGNKLHLSNILH